MMNNPSIQRKEIDVIAFETKHQQDYEQSELVQEFSRNYQQESRTTFEDGQWDGYLDFEPQPYQWSKPQYRSGYLSGVGRKFDEQFSC